MPLASTSLNPRKQSRARTTLRSVDVPSALAASRAIFSNFHLCTQRTSIMFLDSERLRLSIHLSLIQVSSSFWIAAQTSCQCFLMSSAFSKLSSRSTTTFLVSLRTLCLDEAFGCGPLRPAPRPGFKPRVMVCGSRKPCRICKLRLQNEIMQLFRCRLGLKYYVMLCKHVRGKGRSQR